MSEYRPSKPITVDVNEWLAERQAVPGNHGLAYPGSVHAHPDQIDLPANASPEEQERIKALQQKLREEWALREELAERNHLLDNTPRECVECSVTRKHYRDDYICYRCRDAQGGPA